MNKKHIILSLAIALSSLNISAQDKNFANLNEYFTNFTNPNFPNLKKITVEDIIPNTRDKHLTIVLSDNFIAQPLTPLVVGDLYTDVKRLLPMPYNTYDISIFAKDTPIELLIPTSMMDRGDTARVYKRELYKGNPWVTPLSRPYNIKKGLQGRHLAVGQSHGKYYNFDKQEWVWQRPRLFCTTEDIYESLVFQRPIRTNFLGIILSPNRNEQDPSSAGSPGI